MPTIPLKIRRQAQILRVTLDADGISTLPKIVKNKELTKPAIILIQPSKPMLSTLGTTKIDSFVDTSKLPASMEFTRDVVSNGGASTGVLYRDSHVFTFRIYYVFPEYNDSISTIQSKLFDAIKETLAEDYGIDIGWSSHRANSNDMVFTTPEGAEKKFGSLLNITADNMINCFISLRFSPTKTVKAAFKLNTDKFKARGTVNDITDVVGGLNELNADIDKKACDLIMARFCKKIYWDSVDINSLDNLE